MELTYYCTRCNKELSFNHRNIRYEIDKVAYTDELETICNECYNKERRGE